MAYGAAAQRHVGAKAPPVDAWTDRIGRLVERHPRLAIALAGLETRLLEERIADTAIDRPIHIAGLARSGSTILLELLAQHPATATHRYRDFPLVLAPFAWSWFVDRAGTVEHAPRERAHRDRIRVTPESPEAFEEVVWMAFHDGLHDPSRNAVLDATTRNETFERFYRDHIRKLLALRGGTRYLAKANYNVTRLRYLKSLFPDARFVVPIRDPVWHIASLMKQHRLFLKAGAEDPRIVDHLGRSGHFEFGPDRRPVRIGDNGTADEIAALWRNGEEAAGWAAQWASVYGHVVGLLEDPAMADAVLVVRYEDLCANPRAIMASILDHCGLSGESLPGVAQSTVSPPSYYEPSFMPSERCEIRARTQAVAAHFGYT